MVEQFRSIVIQNSNRYYIPGSKITIDEAMVKFTGYHPDRHYIGTKPNKFGFKIYILAESTTGYVL
jgi:hypothetical protein